MQGLVSLSPIFEPSRVEICNFSSCFVAIKKTYELCAKIKKTPMRLLYERKTP